MDEPLETFLTEHEEIITAREARSARIRTEQIRAAIDAGDLVRVVRGGYLRRSALLTARYEARHVLRTKVILRVRPELVASHISAAALWGLPVPESELARIHLCYPTRTGTTRLLQAFTVHCCPAEEASTTRDGVNLVVPAVAAIQSALLVRHSIAVGIMDAVRRRGQATVGDLGHWLHRLRHTPGINKARDALSHSDGLAESPPESWLRLILIELGYTVVAQHPIEEDGRAFARVDFYLPEIGVVVEFDGRVKYVKDDGSGDGDAVYREKQREDRIRRLGYGMVRVGINDLKDRRLLDRRIQQAAATARLPELAS